jgi:hypothetical protein
MTMKREEAVNLLLDLSQMGSAGQAEREADEKFAKTFYPVPEHIRAFDPDVVLVVGPRGSGKSELFNAVLKHNLLPAIAKYAPKVRLPSLDSNRTKWIPAYPSGKIFPDPRAQTHFFEQNNSTQAGQDLWLMNLVRVLYTHLDTRGQKEMKTFFDQQGGDVINNYQTFQKCEISPTLALDRLDDLLEKEDRYIFVGYDELDTLGGSNWQTMVRGVTGLVGFWASYSRRWKRIRAKIFLRTDLFERYAKIGGAEIAKLAANRSEIVWNEKNLYGMLIKRIANTSDSLRKYCQSANINFVLDSDLGYVVKNNDEQNTRKFVERLFNPYMGSGIKKGFTYRWLIEHTKDGRGKALPRPLVRLIEIASSKQKDSIRSISTPHLIDHISIRSALDQVSDEHVLGAKNEWLWIEGLKERIRDNQVPWDRRQFELHLQEKWSDSWAEDAVIRPPMDDIHEFVDYLIEIGIVRSRSNERIDVPDLYLRGLGLKRKGGVRKK